jgi:hypothetical protein
MIELAIWKMLIWVVPLIIGLSPWWAEEVDKILKQCEESK